MMTAVRAYTALNTALRTIVSRASLTRLSSRGVAEGAGGRVPNTGYGTARRAGALDSQHRTSCCGAQEARPGG